MLSIVIGGQAGQGPNAIAHIVGSVLAKWGYYVFVSRDYGSFIRGGHNANFLTISECQIMSNVRKIDVLVSLDKNTKIIHKDNLSKRSVNVEAEGENNMYFAGRLVKMMGVEFKILEEELKKLKNFEVNLRAAKKGYEFERDKFKLPRLSQKIHLANGSEGAAEGAIKSGLDVYYAYPMTPATPLLNELAERQLLSNYFVFEMESEIGAVNAAIGSAITGAKAMVGTSGGGFDLMTEAVSLAGMAEVPIVTYLAQRPGPSTGVPTYTSQGDLNMARHCGHGEFPRVVSAPGEPVECAELTSQAFYLSQKYKVPAIIISDKHLAESLYAVSESPIITPSEKSAVLKKYNSYEHDLRGLAVEDAVSINKNFERRMQKQIDIEAEAEKFRMFKIYGEEKSKNLILFWGSTKGAVLDALKSVNARALQVLYMEPFSQKIKNEIEKARNVFVVENNATSQLSQLVAEKTGFLIPEKNRILKYDGRPFLSDELAVELKRRMR